MPKSRACKASCGTRRRAKRGCWRNSTGRAGVVSGRAGESRSQPVGGGVLAGPARIFETRRQVFQSQAAVNREKRSQVEKEIEGLRAQESAASRRIEIVREEAATVATLVSKGLERRPRLLNLERETPTSRDVGARLSRRSRAPGRSSASPRRFCSNWSMTGKTRSRSRCARCKTRSFRYASDCGRPTTNSRERRSRRPRTAW